MPEAGHGFEPVPEERYRAMGGRRGRTGRRNSAAGITRDAKQLGAAAKTTKADLVVALENVVRHVRRGRIMEPPPRMATTMSRSFVDRD